MSNVTPMFENYGATQSLRDKGYGSADFNIEQNLLTIPVGLTMVAVQIQEDVLNLLPIAPIQGKS